MARKHKKFERKEKSKVKLKTKKKPLMKAQNVTDTSFKIRKIVLPQQLKTGIQNDLVTTYKRHNVKELLSKLHHHNVTMREDSLTSLHKMVMYHPEEVLGLQLAGLIEGVSDLILDRERKIRKQAIKLLELILSQVPTSRVLPFFNVLVTYLCCGMTHLNTSIQDDSLSMLDIFLASTPDLIATNSAKILPNFLNMISQQNSGLKKGCVLKVNLGGKFTSAEWYVKVLNRVHALMSTMLAHKKKCGNSGDDSNNVEMVHWNGNHALYVELYMPYYKKTCDLSSVFNVANSSYENGNIDVISNMLKEYANSLMPVLIEIWREVAPTNENSAENPRILSEEAAELLMQVLEVIKLLCELLEDEAAGFISAYKKTVVSLFFRHFPFIHNQEQGAGMKFKKSIGEKKGRSNCHTQNLTICQLYLCYHMHHDNPELCIRVLKYLKSQVRQWKDQDAKHQIEIILKRLLLKNNSQCVNCDKNLHIVLDVVITLCLKNFDPELFQLLIDFAETPRRKQLHRLESFENWIKSLPANLCKPVISAKTVDMLTKFACQNSPIFQISLCENLPNILSNLTSVVIKDAQNEYASKKSIINILYWVKDWPHEASYAVRKLLHSSHWEKELLTHLRDVLSLRGLMLE